LSLQSRFWVREFAGGKLRYLQDIYGLWQIFMHFLLFLLKGVGARGSEGSCFWQEKLGMCGEVGANKNMLACAGMTGLLGKASTKKRAWSLATPGPVER
jgi:hypothetical protein